MIFSDVFAEHSQKHERFDLSTSKLSNVLFQLPSNIAGRFRKN